MELPPPWLQIIDHAARNKESPMLAALALDGNLSPNTRCTNTGFVITPMRLL
jgi:hypothetical protein